MPQCLRDIPHRNRWGQDKWGLLLTLYEQFSSRRLLDSHRDIPGKEFGRDPFPGSWFLHKFFHKAPTEPVARLTLHRLFLPIFGISAALLQSSRLV
jgi:hypothetical protein